MLPNTTTAADLERKKELAKQFKDINLPTMTMAEMNDVAKLGGWQVTYRAASRQHSPHYFRNTLNINNDKLGPGETPQATAQLTHPKFKGVVLSKILPLDQLDKTSAEYAMTAKFLDDAKKVKKAQPAPAHGSAPAFQGMMFDSRKPRASGFGTTWG